MGDNCVIKCVCKGKLLLHYFNKDVYELRTLEDVITARVFLKKLTRSFKI